MENQSLKKLKTVIHSIAIHLLGYLAIFIGIIFFFSLVMGVLYIFHQLIGLSPFLILLVPQLEGIGMIVGGVIGVLFFYKRGKQSLLSIFSSHSEKKKMTVEWFITFTFLLLASQFIFEIFAIVLEWLLNQMGLTMMNAIRTSTLQDPTMAMFLYSAFFAPLFEEVVFRKGVIDRLKAYGSIFSIVFSSLVFALVHMNLIQGLFAFLVGILLAFVYIEFGLKWAVTLHVLNNFVIAFLVEKGAVWLMGETSAVVFMNALMLIAFVTSMVIIFLYRLEIFDYIRLHRTSKQVYRTAFSSIALWLFILICLIMAVLSGIQPIH